MLILAGCGPAAQPVASASPVTVTPAATGPSPTPYVVPVGSPLPAGRPLSKVAVLNDRDAVVAGDGLILRTADGGARWTPVYEGAAKVRMLHWVDSRNLVAATSLGLLKSRDGGYHWRLMNPRTDLIRLHFIDPINGFAIAGSIPGGWIDPDFPLANAVAGAELLRTWDGGVSFHHRATALPLVQWVQFVTPLHGWAAGPDGIEATLDGGSSWQVQLRFPSTLFRYDGRVWWGAQVGFRDELHGFAFYRADQTVMSAGSGRLYYTADGGFHWQLQSYTSPGEAPDAVGAPMTLPWSVNGELVVTGPGSAMILETNFTTYQTDRCSSDDAGRSWGCSTLAFTGAASGQLAVRDGIEWLALTDQGASVAEIAISHDGGSSWNVNRFPLPNGYPTS